MAVSSEDFLKGIIYSPILKEQNDIVKIFKYINKKIRLECNALENLNLEKRFLLNNMLI